jgi:hypothetical protein
MRNRPQAGQRTARGASSAAILAIGGLGLAWLCIRTTAVELLPSTSPTIARMAPDAPAAVLERAADALVRQRGQLSPATLDAVRRAAAAAPLDARAYLILGHQQLLDGAPRRAVETLEAGRRLDARQRLIHLLLLDRYLRTWRYTDAAAELSVLARLMGATQGPVATAMAQMVLAPQTREAVQRTLATNPMLERSVLVALARSAIRPDALFALATPPARAGAGDKESWGPVLVNRLVDRGRFAEARQVWARVYGLTPAQGSAPIFDASFRDTPASAPFNWTLVAGSLGAADIRDGGLAIDYYGRDSGALASQLLVLAPGRYRFAFTVDAGTTDNAARLGWTIACATGAKPVLASARIAAAASRRRLATEFTVPLGCPAQTLTLVGEAGDLPAPTTVTVRDLDLRPLGGTRP